MAKRGGKRRDPARERFWRRTIRQQEKSGLTVPDFCRREGLKDWTFRWWRQELARRDQQPASVPQQEQEQDGPPSEASPAFLPVRIAAPDPLASQPPPIEIVWPTGPTLRVPAGFDRRTLDEI